MIIRNDDVNPNTDLEKLYDLYECLGRTLPECKIVSGVTLFGKRGNTEAIYPDLPLKTKDNKYLYNVDKLMNRHTHIIGEIASHGTVHVKHSKLSKDAQEMSIVSSCRFLGTDQFIAPFNDYNEDTVDVCVENKIELVNKMYNWKCMEYNQFDSSHKYWYFHSWRFTLKSLREYLNADIASHR